MVTRLSYICLVALGGALGSVLRYLVTLCLVCRLPSCCPYGKTLIINIVGCALIGFLLGMVTRGWLSESMRLLLVVGVAGGFTTFSTFSLESLTLLEQGRVWESLLYILLSVVLGLLATYGSVVWVRSC